MTSCINLGISGSGGLDSVWAREAADASRVPARAATERKFRDMMTRSGRCNGIKVYDPASLILDTPTYGKVRRQCVRRSQGIAGSRRIVGGIRCAPVPTSPVHLSSSAFDVAATTVDGNSPR